MNLRGKITMRRVTLKSKKFHNHKYLPLQFPLILLLCPSLNGGGTPKYRPYMKRQFHKSFNQKAPERHLSKEEVDYHRYV